MSVIRRRLVPYLLLGPGTFWLVLFFLVPLYYLGRLSLESGVVGSLRFDWHWTNY
jgi:spermidine/putrescine transport system permease protein